MIRLPRLATHLGRALLLVASFAVEFAAAGDDDDAKLDLWQGLEPDQYAMVARAFVGESGASDGVDADRQPWAQVDTYSHIDPPEWE